MAESLLALFHVSPQSSVADPVAELVTQVSRMYQCALLILVCIGVVAVLTSIFVSTRASAVRHRSVHHG